MKIDVCDVLDNVNVVTQGDVTLISNAKILSGNDNDGEIGSTVSSVDHLSNVATDVSALIIINNNKPICNAPDASVTDPEARRTLRNITVRVDQSLFVYYQNAVQRLLLTVIACLSLPYLLFILAACTLVAICQLEFLYEYMDMDMEQF